MKNKLSSRNEAGKSKRDENKMNGENKTLERNNKSVRQTRFEERLDAVSGSSDDISGESGTEARANSIAIEVNAMIPQEERIEKCTQRAPSVDMRTTEIALKVKINGRLIKAILNTGSPVTVVVKHVYLAH